MSRYEGDRYEGGRYEGRCYEGRCYEGGRYEGGGEHLTILKIIINMTLRENIDAISEIAKKEKMEFVNCGYYDIYLSAKGLSYEQICEICDKYDLSTTLLIRKIDANPNSKYENTGDCGADENPYFIKDGYEFLTAFYKR